MPYRNALLVLVLGANIAVGVAFAAQRGCFRASRPSTVRVVDLDSYERFTKQDPKGCIAEFKDQWVLIGGTVIDTGSIPYDFSEKWYVRLGTSTAQPPPYITLEFEVGQGDKLRKLRRGDSIVVIGRVGSLHIIDRCEMVS